MGDVRVGAVTVGVGGTLEPTIRRILDQAAPRATEVLEGAARKIYDDAYGQWPVKTGFSKANLDWGLAVRSLDTVETFVVSRAPYTIYIKGRGQRGKATWIELLRKPARALAPELARELGSAIVRR